VMFRLAEVLRSSPTLVSAMVRVAIEALAVQTFWQGWAQIKWTEAQLVRLQPQFQSIDLLTDFDRALREGEVAGINYLCDHYSVSQIIQVFGLNNPSRASDLAVKMAMYLAPRGWRYQNQVRYNQIMGIARTNLFLDRPLRIDPIRWENAARELNRSVDQAGPFNLLARTAVPNFYRAGLTVARNQTWLNQAVLACALERFKIQKGHYPERLRELTPDFLKSVAIDFLTGHDYVYQRLANDRFQLYSPGWNGADEHGLVSAKSDQGDWIWPARPEHQGESQPR
jgi:hypothetical protein